jgi:HEAT repeat protein
MRTHLLSAVFVVLLATTPSHAGASKFKLDGRPLGEWIVMIRDSTPENKKAALEAIAKLNDAALDQLIGALKSPDRDTRGSAAALLPEFGRRAKKAIPSCFGRGLVAPAPSPDPVNLAVLTLRDDGVSWHGIEAKKTTCLTL